MKCSWTWFFLERLLLFARGVRLPHSLFRLQVEQFYLETGETAVYRFDFQVEREMFIWKGTRAVLRQIRCRSKNSGLQFLQLSICLLSFLRHFHWFSSCNNSMSSTTTNRKRSLPSHDEPNSPTITNSNTTIIIFPPPSKKLRTNTYISKPQRLSHNDQLRVYFVQSLGAL